MRSDADFLVELSVLRLVLLGSIAGVLATGAGLRGTNGAAGEGTLRSRLGRECGFGRRLAKFHFGGS